MYRRVLLALDLEGVNNVVGEPYMGLTRDTEQWSIARKQAVLEINAAAEALFEVGVEKVGLWDNHGGGNNIDRALLDRRITFVSADPGSERMSFANGEYDCICYFGYHAMEGTLGGVLAHTMNSKMVQYYKLNGHYIGEIDMDAYIAAYYGMPSRFFAGGDITCDCASFTAHGSVRQKPVNIFLTCLRSTGESERSKEKMSFLPGMIPEDINAPSLSNMVFAYLGSSTIPKCS